MDLLESYIISQTRCKKGSERQRDVTKTWNGDDDDDDDDDDNNYK